MQGFVLNKSKTELNMKKNQWILGFFGFLGFLGVPAIRDHSWAEGWYFLNFLWFIYFIPKKKK